MKQDKNKLTIFTFYRFVKINDKRKIKSIIDKFLKKRLIKGTILLANEGINASISGRIKDLSETIKIIKKLLKIRKLDIKINVTDTIPFNRIKVRLKKEIVSLGKGNIEVKNFDGNFLNPSEWNKFILQNDIKLIDTRNEYEIDIGSFQGSINPKTKTFREFPNKLKSMGINKGDKLAIFCTGGIRCEKASAYLRKNGYKNVSQLRGGILNYLDYAKEKQNHSLWNGECFVFDDRVTVNKDLNKGKYLQCHGCRHPIAIKDTYLRSYKKGVSCKYCVNKRTQIQKFRSKTRQDQIDRAESLGIDHSFKKIKSINL